MLVTDKGSLRLGKRELEVTSLGAQGPRPNPIWCSAPARGFFGKSAAKPRQALRGTSFGCLSVWSRRRFVDPQKSVLPFTKEGFPYHELSAVILLSILIQIHVRI